MSTTYPAYRGFRIEEEVALKALLSGLTVPDANGNQLPVPVWYHLPQTERREISYPNIVITFLGEAKDAAREHRGLVTYWYESYTANALDPTVNPNGATASYPIPLTLTYQVAVSSRNQQHDALLQSVIQTSVLPWRFGQLNCPSGVNRRLDVVALTPVDTIDADKKRLFRKVWTIQIDAEIVPAYPAVLAPITTVDVTVTGNGETESFSFT